MEYCRTCLCILWICLYQGIPILSKDVDGEDFGNSLQSSTVIDLKVIHGRRNGSFSPFEQDHTLCIQFEYQNEDYILDLTHNRQLEAENAVLRYKQNGTYVTEQVKSSKHDHCLYIGTVRGRDHSSVALSTCGGVISGVVTEPGRHLLLSPAPGGRHLLRTTNVTPARAGSPDRQGPHTGIRRQRREVESLRGPVRAGPKSLYLELALVLDNRVYRENGHDIRTVHRRAKQIANIVHSIYARLDIFVALVGVDVWSEGDEITLSANADDTLTNFLFYRERLATEMPNDNAQLITGTKFEGGIVGKALRRVMCTYDNSGGVSTDHSTQVSLVAATVAHEMGHNFGLEHDTASCECPDERCVMSASASSVGPTQWSSCSKEQLRRSLQHGLGHCLHDKPSGPLFSPPVCGNGFVEAGEECDCGLPSDCATPCCDPNTCRLKQNGTCASGACCDLQTCRPRPAGQPCRPVSGECDLAEYCNGTSELCPADVHRLNGLPCADGQSHCYGGRCSTRDAQCRRLWGHSGYNSAQQCYDQNIDGILGGDCGYNWQTESYTACRPSDVLCGRLHCAHLNERLEYGVESSAKLSASFMKPDGKVLPCRSAVVDLGLRQRDPGLVPQGAVCGSGKMCVDQQCVLVSAVTAGGCPRGCGGRGVCNSRGNCHCDYGWAPPNCTERGVGGSIDSGPNLQRDAANTAAIVLFVIFLGVVPAVALILCCLYCRRQGLSPAQFLRRPTCCRLPACACPALPACPTLPACRRLPACVCPKLPSLTTLRRKLPTGGGGSTPRPTAAARSIRRPDVPRDPPGKTASYNIRLLVLSGEDELLQPSAASAATPPVRPPPPATAAPAPPAAAPAVATVPPGRGLASSLLGRLGSLARPATTEGTGRASDKLVCEVKPTTKSPTGKPTVTPTTSPTRKAGKDSRGAEPAAGAAGKAGKTAGAGGSGGGGGVQKVVADKLRPSQAPRTTFGLLGRQPAGSGTDAAASTNSAADSKRRTTFGMTPLGKDTGGKPGDKPAGGAAGVGKAGGPEAGGRPVSGAAAVRSAFLSGTAGKPSVPSGPPPARVVTGQVKIAASTLDKKPATNTLDRKPATNTLDRKQATNAIERKPVTSTIERKPTVSSPELVAGAALDRKYANIPDMSRTTAAEHKPVDSPLDRKYANIPDVTPTAVAEKKPTVTATLEKRPTSTWDRKPGIRSLLDARPSPLTQTDKPTAAAERIPLVQRSESVPAARDPAAARDPGPGQVRFAPDTLERRSGVARSDSAPAGPQPGGPSSRSSTLESDRGSTGDRDGGGGSRSSTLSRVASVFRRGEKSSDPPAAAAEPGLRASQSFKAAKLDRDTVRNLGISNPIPQPPGQFSTLPTSPRGRRGQGAPARASSDVGRPVRPVSLLVRPSEPPPRPPNVTELYDDCNADWSAGGGVTPTENIYCTIDEAPDERPRPKSMVEPGVLSDAGRLYQNTVDRRAPWRSVGTRQPTVARAESAAARTTKAWSPIAEERSPSVPSLTEPVVGRTATAAVTRPAVVTQPSKTTAASTLTTTQPRVSVPWASKFSSINTAATSGSAAPTFSSKPVTTSSTTQKPTATIAPATQTAKAAEPAKQMPVYAKPTPKSAAKTTAATKPTVAASATTSATTAASRQPAASAGSGKGTGISSQPEGKSSASSASSKESRPISPPGKQTDSASKAGNESPGSVRSVKSTASSTKSSVSSAPASKKTTPSASSSKQPTSQSSKQPASVASSKQPSSSQSSKKTTTPSSSSRPGTLSAASSQQSMSSVASTRSNVSSPSSERTDSTPGRKGATGAAGKKAGTAATAKKTSTGKTETAGKTSAGTAAVSAGKKTPGTAAGKKTATTAAGGRVTSPTSESADRTGAKAGPAASKTSSAAGKTGSAAGKSDTTAAKEPTRVGPAPTKASAARAAAAAAKVGAASKAGTSRGKTSVSTRPGGTGAKSTSKS